MKFNQDYKSRFRILKGGKISLVVSSLLGGMTMSFAAPSGGTVTSGNANITVNGTTTNIYQSSQKASINWQNFSIGKNETVNFKQPNINSITLNRVIGNERSIINGALNANGQVWILNSNGVLFGKTASINTAGLLATTKKLSDANFNAGNYTFKGDSTQSVINLGTIDISDSGYASLIANNVSNDGTIKVVKGKVTLIGASEVTINLNGNSLVNLTVNTGVLDALVENKGAVYADSGEIYLTTNAVNELLKGVVNNTGILEANSFDEISGKIELFAHGGEVKVAGTLKAEGGFIETSGKKFTMLEDVEIKADEWLIDPVNITIDTTLAGTIETVLGSGNVTITTDGSNTPSTSSAESGTEGNINVNSAITWSTANTFTLSAANNININQSITATHANGVLALHYGQANVSGGNTSTYNVNAPINLQAGNNFITKLGSDGTTITWKVITELGSEGSTTGTDLQGMNANLSGNYVLGKNINANNTSSWNSGAGFNPIGDKYYDSTGFAGNFDGLGHTIDKLFINRPSETYIGLFGSIDNSDIKNIGLIDVDITGNEDVGGLVGYSYSSIVNNTYSTGEVTGNQYIGGLIGSSYGSMSTENYSDVDVSGNTSVGGLQGSSGPGTIKNSYATGDVTGLGGSSSNIGGLIGNNGDIIENTYATGTVKGNDKVGGLVGTNGGTIKNSYATGRVSGNNNLGGLVGTSYGNVNNSFWDTQTSGQSTSAGGEGKTTVEMQDISTFSDAGWSIEEDSSTAKSIPFLTMNGSTPIWKIATKVTAETPEAATSETEAKKVITAITNNNSIKITIPKLVTPIIKSQVKTQVTSTQGLGFKEGTKVALVSKPLENEATKMVTLSEIKAMQSSKSEGQNDTDSTPVVKDIRISLSQNSIVELVNGGVNLPDGVEQEFYVVEERGEQL